MADASKASSAWTDLLSRLQRLRDAIGRVKTQNINSRAMRADVQQFVQFYFSTAKGEARRNGVSDGVFAELDGLMHALSRYSHGNNARKSYMRTLRDAQDEALKIEALGHEALVEPTAATAAPIEISEFEKRVIETLAGTIASAAVSYEQACRDLADRDRISFRGAALELREALREVLDHLAPDAEVEASPGYKAEPNRTKPTMRQKARFILRAREYNDTEAKPPEDATAIVDDVAARLVRGTYDLGSLGAHVARERGRVRQIKMYVDSVLAELLQIYSQPEPAAGRTSIAARRPAKAPPQGKA